MLPKFLKRKTPQEKLADLRIQQEELHKITKNFTSWSDATVSKSHSLAVQIRRLEKELAKGGGVVRLSVVEKNQATADG